MVDTLTGWVDAFPSKDETASTVTNVLCSNIIPRFGLPNSMQSDNGPAFISKVTQQMAHALDIS